MPPARRRPIDPDRRPEIAEIVVADPPSVWRDLGFELDGDSFGVGTVTVRLAGEGTRRGIVGWSLRAIKTNDLDGLPTTLAYDEPPAAPGAHSNGVRCIDHVVVVTPSLDRTVAAFDDAGVKLRRVRDAGSPQRPLRQGFLRLGEVIVELVQPPPGASARVGASSLAPAQESDPARFWGMVFVVDDLAGLARELGDRLGSPRDAVQPGRRIATLQDGAGTSVPVAFITPEPSEVGHR